jgi:hypothetical protein
VPRRGLTLEWSIDLDESFRGRVVDEDLQLVSPGPPVRTIWVAVWGPSPDQQPADLLDAIMKDVPPSPLRRFREEGTDADELRYASWYPETDEGREQWSSMRTPFAGLLCTGSVHQRRSFRPWVGLDHLAILAIPTTCSLNVTVTRHAVGGRSGWPR